MSKLNQTLNYMHLRDLGDRLYDIYWDNIGWRIRNLKASIKNVIRWFPIIWKDRDWDDHFIWEILKTKLKHQADYISKYDRHINAQYDTKKMRLCVKLIEKIQDEYYATEYLDYQKSELKFIPSKIRENCYELEIDELSENFDDYLSKHKSTVNKILSDKSLQPFKLEKSGKDYKRRLAMNVGRYKEKQVQNILFNLLNRDIKKWWD